ncbi:MAG: phenylalanine--tRNA ligase subunit alpha [Fimbriimonadaceae bacterium]|nr:phenylalanine--tRNA ligase subunit alpha [Chitinophagales bacterium]
MQYEGIDNIKTEIENYLITDAETLEQFRIQYLGTKNVLKDLFTAIKDIPNENKKEYGQKINAVKQLAEEKFALLQLQFQNNKADKKHFVDTTLPVAIKNQGAKHPITLIREELVTIFSKIGYLVAEGPEIETDWYNFTALGIPEDHPAKDMQDTFYIQTNPDIVLRTHTSNVQIRVMENQNPPIRIIAPGRTYRNETISARAHCVFHQIELLYIDEGVSMADLKQTLLYLAQELFGTETQIRLRPSYFPFTEPSAELDVSCFICGGSGCAVCKYTGWVEIGGAGMVDPLVLENCKIDSEKYTGFAFGMGLERMAMLKYRINDIRLMSENDFRFLKQFENS